MVRKLLISLFICFLSLVLNACATSTFVSSIGANQIHGMINLDRKINKDFLQLYDSELNIDALSLSHGLAFPYHSLSRDFNTKGKKLVATSVKYTDIKWFSKSHGQVRIDYLGESHLFSVIRKFSKKGQKLTFHKNYRKWYSYPSQSLLLLSVPVDITLDAFVVSLVIIAIPFAVIYNFAFDEL